MRVSTLWDSISLWFCLHVPFLYQLKVLFSNQTGRNSLLVAMTSKYYVDFFLLVLNKI